MNKLEKRFQKIVCINPQNLESDDEDAADDKNEIKVDVNDNIDGTIKFSANRKRENTRFKFRNSRKNSKKSADSVSNEIEYKADLHNISENGRPDKVRRHMPPGSGKYSVGCVDLMDEDSEEGTFCRLFYPVEKTDIYVSF